MALGLGLATEIAEAVVGCHVAAWPQGLSLQTEPDNAAALALYSQCGFTINADLATLTLNIAR